MFNILTIDLEDYFQVHAFSNVIKYEDWGNCECRIERNTDRLLEILKEVTDNSKFKTQNSESNDSLPSPQTSITHSLNNSLTRKVQATFFILGWIAERYPDLVRRIQKEDHEIACHGYAHQLVYTQSRDEFRQDIKRAKSILEDITSSEVIGYRAPSYSITNKSQWAFEVLAEEGFKYDSSIFPIRHDFYGMPEAPRFPFLVSLNGDNNVEFSMLNFEVGKTGLQHGSTAALDNSLTFSPNNSVSESQSSVLKAIDGLEPQHDTTAAPNISFTHSLIDSRALIEFPLSTVKLFGQNFPISGGGYFRLFPYGLIRKGLKGINEREGKPFIFYMHPWEIDPHQPRVKGISSRSKIRHYVNLDKTEVKFKKLLSDFQFSTIRQFLTQN